MRPQYIKIKKFKGITLYDRRVNDFNTINYNGIHPIIMGENDCNIGSESKLRLFFLYVIDTSREFSSN